MKRITTACLWLLSLTLTSTAVSSTQSLDSNSVNGELVIYTAQKIITMEAALPEASAVAVADGRIVAVGSLKSLSSWSDQKEVRIDRRFENKVIMPGFIDPHVHPSLPAVLTQFP